MILPTPEDMRRLDQAARDQLGIPAAALMELAGARAAAGIAELDHAQIGVAVFCGPGHNGGDGFVIARHLANHGLPVSVFLWGNLDDLPPLPRGYAEVWLRMGREIVAIDESTAQMALEIAAESGVIVDALLGTGQHGPMPESLGALIEGLNAVDTFRVAVDLPTGLDGATGRPFGPCFDAEMTFTFGHLKLGMALQPGVGLCGEVVIIDIGIPPELSKRLGVRNYLLTEPGVRAVMPTRDLETHKGRLGHLVVLAGGPGKSGAAILAAHASLLAGTGLVTLAADAATAQMAVVRHPELMTYLVGGQPGIAPREHLRLVAEGKTAAVAGPGWDPGPDALEVLLALLDTKDFPIVLDAEALNLLAAHPEAGRASLARRVRREAPTLLTPHPGEAARLLGYERFGAVQADRPGAARAIAEAWHATTILKGHRSLVATPDGRLFVNPTGNPGMATAGAGDVLAGFLGGLAARGMDPVEAACLAVFAHGFAGDKAAEELGPDAVSATAISAHLPAAIKSIASVEDGQVRHVWGADDAPNP